jgi:hypothetical protein
MDIAQRSERPLRIAAKVGNLPKQRSYFDEVFRPALERAGRSVEYLGELNPGERDQLFSESYATLMPGAWPEPFGLVSIESLACGTPILARRVGALPEIIREGVDGFFGDDPYAMAFYAERLGGLDRRAIRERVIERFSAARMTDRYEELYARMLGRGRAVTDALRDRFGRAGAMMTSPGVAVGPGREAEPAGTATPASRPAVMPAGAGPRPTASSDPGRRSPRPFSVLARIGRRQAGRRGDSSSLDDRR